MQQHLCTSTREQVQYVELLQIYSRLAPAHTHTHASTLSSYIFRTGCHQHTHTHTRKYLEFIQIYDRLAA
jgi:hypothetical protein